MGYLSLFLDSFKGLVFFFHMKWGFLMKRQSAYLLTLKNIGDIAENKTYFSFDVIEEMVICHFILELIISI